MPEGYFVEWAKRIGKQFIIGDILDPPEQAVVLIQVPVHFAQPRGQCIAWNPGFGGEANHR